MVGKYSLLLFLLAGTISAYAQDAIIFRDGRVKPVKIIQVNNDKTPLQGFGRQDGD